MSASFFPVPLLSHPRGGVRAVVGASLCAVLVASCSAPSQSSPDSPTANASSSQTREATTYPLTVDNCGTTTTFDSVPERVVTLKSSTTELLLALGRGDRIVATSYLDGPVAPWLEDEAAQVPAVSAPLDERLPSLEKVLETEPDLIFAGWESMVTAEGLADRDRLTQLGVNTLVAPSACKEDGYRPDPLTWESLAQEITTVGTIFDAHSEAQSLVDTMNEQLAAISPDSRGLSALWFSSGSDTPFVGGGSGSAQLVMDTVGLRNIGSDIDDTWGPMSWEAIIDANPDVIVLVDSSWSSAQKKKDILTSHPVASTLDAVVNDRYLVIDFPPTEPGVRTADGAVALADQLAALTVED